MKRNILKVLGDQVNPRGKEKFVHATIALEQTTTVEFVHNALFLNLYQREFSNIMP